MNPNKALWEKGDFTRIASTMREGGEAVVAAIGVAKGLKVLDLGCGDGTTALPAARLGADVLGVDIARNLVEAGNKRAQQEGLSNCRFQEGDATNLSERGCCTTSPPSTSNEFHRGGSRAVAVDASRNVQPGRGKRERHDSRESCLPP